MRRAMTQTTIETKAASGRYAGVRTAVGGWAGSALYTIAAVVFLLFVWEVLVRLYDAPIWLVPKPSDFLPRFFVDLPLIAGHAWSTSVTLFLGFVAAIAVSVPLAWTIVSFGVLERGLYPIIVFLNIMPKTVIGPILIVWFGIGPLVSVVIVFLMCFFPILVDSMSGFRSVDRRLFYITRSMGARPWQELWHVRLPASATYIFAGMKIGIVKATEGVIIAEFIASDRGLGFMIMNASSFMDLTLLFSGLIAAAIVALIFNALVLTAERLAMPWAR